MSHDAEAEALLARMTRPAALVGDEPLLWSTGTGNDVWAMLRACVAGDLDAVRALVARDPALARCNHGYRTPIYFAVRENRLEVAAFLLAHGADPLGFAVSDTMLDIARDRGYTEMERLLADANARAHGASPAGEPVAAAIRARDLTEVRRLLDASPELLHAGDAGSNQPIHWAVMTRQPDVVDELIARGADVDAPRHDGARPIQLTNGDYGFRGWRDVPGGVPSSAEVLAHLRARGAYLDINTAARVGDVDRVRTLLDADPSLANRTSEYVTYYAGSGSPLRNAAAAGHVEMVRLLLDRGADPNLREEGIAPRGHALYSAVAGKHHEIARLLIARGAFPNPPVESLADAMSIALSHGDAEMVELLAAHGAWRPVHMLAYYGDVVTAAAMFAVDPDRADDPEALANAASEGHESFVRLMLRHRPDVARRVAVGVAARGPDGAIGSRAIADLLFAHGMDPSLRDWLGITPLHTFARRGDVESAALFLDHGADLHARDDDIRSTPLGWAAKFGQRAMVELLLARGAMRVHPDDPAWATPRAWATRRGHAEIAALLAAE